MSMKKYLFGLLIVLIALPAFAVTELKQEGFEAFIKEKSVVEFYSPKCPHCKNMEPTVEKFISAHPEYQVSRMNVEENQEFAQNLGVRSWPVFYVYDGGVKIRQVDGEMPYEKLERMILVGESINEKYLRLQSEFYALQQQGNKLLLRMQNIEGQLQMLSEISNEQQPKKAQ